MTCHTAQIVQEWFEEHFGIETRVTDYTGSATGCYTVLEHRTKTSVSESAEKYCCSWGQVQVLRDTLWSTDKAILTCVRKQ